MIRNPLVSNLLQEKDWRNVEESVLHRDWIKVNEEREAERWVPRWTALQQESDPKCLEELEKKLKERRPVQNPIDWSPGTPHYKLSKYLTWALRGGNSQIRSYKNEQGDFDMDIVMMGYVPDRNFTVTVGLLAEVVNHSETQRFAARVALDQYEHLAY